MKQVNDPEQDSNMLDEYDFSTGVRGKYSQRYTSGSNVVVLAPDVAEIFTDSESVNQALRILADLVRQQSKKPSA
jgi:hypothetical protein